MEYKLRPDFFYMARHPEVFRGEMRKTHYFEGWYYNLKTSSGKTLVVIPGISRENSRNSHAFIQIIDDGQSMNIKYDLSEFSFTDEPFSIKIGKNEFTLFSIKLDINEKVRYQGDVYFKNVRVLKKTRYAPSIMGPFSYYPFMQCNHGILCMNATIKGNIDTGKKQMDFDKGRVYIEKNWGSSFPRKYLWLQCNDFEDNKASLLLAIADVPFMGSNFRGVICVLQRGNKQNIFASYYLVRIKTLVINNDYSEIELKQGKFSIKIKADLEDGMKLIAPNKGCMKDYIYESVTSKVNVQLLYKNKILFESSGNNTAFEYKDH